DHAGDLVELALQHQWVGDHQPVHVQHPVAVVGGYTLAPDRLSAGVGHDLPADQAARHRNHLDRQRETAEYIDLLGRIDDAHELPARLGDDFLAGQGRASALDQPLVRVALVGAV